MQSAAHVACAALETILCGPRDELNFALGAGREKLGLRPVGILGCGPWEA